MNQIIILMIIMMTIHLTQIQIMMKEMKMTFRENHL